MYCFVVCTHEARDDGGLRLPESVYDMYAMAHELVTAEEIDTRMRRMPKLVAAHPGWRLPSLVGKSERAAEREGEWAWPAAAFRGPKVGRYTPEQDTAALSGMFAGLGVQP